MNNFELEAATKLRADSNARTGKKSSPSLVIQMLPKLLQLAAWGQKEQVMQLGHEIARGLESSHPAVAQRVQKQLSSTMSATKIVHRPETLVDFKEARHGLTDVILPAAIERNFQALVREHQRAVELSRFHLAPRHKLLLYGPPGNGKTLLAEALSKELELPFIPVKYSGMIDSHLGESGKNLQSIFDYASNAPCVLFMDEFDGVAIDRGDSKDVGEIRRVTNQLLILLERLPSSCMFVAATNAEELLDRAIHRRFDMVMELPAPTLDLRRRCAQRELSTDLTPGHDVTGHIEAVAALPLMNLSALVKLCQRIRRDLVLNDGNDVQHIIQTEQATLGMALQAA